MQTTEVLEPKAPASRSMIELVSQAWAWVFLLSLIVFFSITGQGFFSLTNFQNIGANMAFVLLMAIGQTFVIISAGIDLSTGYVMGLAAVASAIAVTSLAPDTPLLVVTLVALAAGVVGGLIPGFINGWLIARLNVPPFIVTLGMFGIARGLAFLGTGGLPIPVRIPGFGQIGNGYLFYSHPEAGTSFFSIPVGLTGPQLREVTSFLPHPVTLIIVAVIIAHFLLSRTQFGLHVYAIGGSREAALRAGIPVQKRTIQIYILSSLFAAVAGVLYITRFTSGAANAGEALLLDSIAAVVIGGASLFGGGGTIIGTVIGALIIAIIQNGLVIMAVNPFWQFVAVGIVIILAVLIDQAKERVLKEKG